MPIDPLLSVFVALIILRSAWHVVRQSGHILLEAAPDGFDRRKVAEAIVAEVPCVTRVHHVHAWSITQERPMATLEADVSEGADIRLVKQAIKSVLQDTFGIEHTTVEINQLPTSAVALCRPRSGLPYYKSIPSVRVIGWTILPLSSWATRSSSGSCVTPMELCGPRN